MAHITPKLALDSKCGFFLLGANVTTKFPVSGANEKDAYLVFLVYFGRVTIMLPALSFFFIFFSVFLLLLPSRLHPFLYACLYPPSSFLLFLTQLLLHLLSQTVRSHTITPYAHPNLASKAESSINKAVVGRMHGVEPSYIWLHPMNLPSRPIEKSRRHSELP